MEDYYMPGEYGVHHLGCLMLYPHNRGTWRGSKCQYARKAFRDVARAISTYGDEDVFFVCNDSQDATNLAADLEREKISTIAEDNGQHRKIHILQLPSNDSWARDTGPTFLLGKSGKGKLAGVDWEFNAYGGKEAGCYWPCEEDRQLAKGMIDAISKNHGIKINHIPRKEIVVEGGGLHVDGEGTVLLTEETLLDPNRNPNMSKSQIEELLLQQLGATKMIWIPRGLYMDEDTKGHIDNIACFISPGHVALAWTDDINDPQYKISQEAYGILENSTDAMGRKLIVHKINIPPPIFWTAEEVASLEGQPGSQLREVGQRLAASYVNCYIANKAVILPGFAQSDKDSATATADSDAVKAFEALFITRKVVQIPSHEIILGGGNIHCITQQIPEPAKQN